MDFIQKLQHLEVQKFISQNKDVNINEILLKKSPSSELSIQEIAQQIKGRQIAHKKFPFLVKQDIIFPPHLNLEQSSSEATAKYKSQLLGGEKFIDLTSGFGIDAYFIAQNFTNTLLVEQNETLLNIVQHNWAVLGQKAHFLNMPLEQFLRENNALYDAIYIDPARRNENHKKVFLLEELSPNILEIQEELLNISDTVLIKLSPLIDIAYLVSVLHSIAEIHIVALRNEVKEILVLLQKGNKQSPIIKSVNLESQEPDFTYIFNEKTSREIEFSEPLSYLYIPNNAILKSGAFAEVAQRYCLKKLHPNTHLYTSSELIADFSGRTLKIKPITSKELTKGEKFNIISKNYPLKPEEIKKKYKITDGGERYLIFTQSVKGKVILISE